MKTRNDTPTSRRRLRIAALLAAVMLLAMAAQTARAQATYNLTVACQYYYNGSYCLGNVGGTAMVHTPTTTSTITNLSNFDIQKGASVTLTAMPAAGYKFIEWAIINGNAPTGFSPNDASTSFLMPNSSLVFVAKFDENFQVNRKANPAHGGTVQVSTDNTNFVDRLKDVPSGTTVYYRCTANSGYLFSSVGIAPYEGAVSMAPSGSFTMPSNDVMVTIDFGSDPGASAPAYPTVLSDYKDFTLAYATALDGQTATYSRNFTKGVAATLCLPFPISTSQVSGAGTLYKFGGVNDSRTEVTMTDAATIGSSDGIYPARPYLFIPDVDGTVTFSGGISSSFYNPGSTLLDHWSFTGTFSKIEWKTDPRNIYGFASGEAYGGSSDATAAGTFIRVRTGGIRPYRAYLQYNGSSARSVTRGEADTLPETMTVRLVSRTGETTAIGTLDTRTGEFSFPDGQGAAAGRSQWFTLDGRRLAGPPAQKGLYIRNGKKEVVK